MRIRKFIYFKKCLRIMTFSEFNSHSNPLFIDLKLLKVRDIIKFHQLKLVYGFYNNLLPTELQNLFVLDSDVHNYETRSATHHLLHIPRINTSSFGNKSIKYTCPISWNFIAEHGISIDNNLYNNVVVDKIYNHFQFTRKFCNL